MSEGEGGRGRTHSVVVVRADDEAFLPAPLAVVHRDNITRLHHATHIAVLVSHVDTDEGGRPRTP